MGAALSKIPFPDLKGVFMCSKETFHAVQRRPTPEEAVLIRDYIKRYRETFGFPAWGFHFIPDFENHGPLWLPVPEEWAEKAIVEGVTPPKKSVRLDS